MWFASFWAICLVLVASGSLRLLDPAGFVRAVEQLTGVRISDPLSRMSGAVEALLGIAGLAFGGRVLALVVAAVYVIFGLVALLARRKGLESCGCFGSAAAAPSGLHIALNFASVAVALLAASGQVTGVADGLAERSMAIATAICLAVLAAAVAVVVVESRVGRATFTGRNSSRGDR